MAAKKNIIGWYKEKIEEEVSPPPEEVWDNIERDLDIDMVWQRVSKRLDHLNLFSKIQKVFYYSAAAIAMFFFIDHFVLNRSAKVKLTDQASISNGGKQINEQPQDANQFIADDTLSSIESRMAAQQTIEKTPGKSNTGKLQIFPVETEPIQKTTPSVIADHQQRETPWKQSGSEERTDNIDSIPGIRPIGTVDEKITVEAKMEYSDRSPAFDLDLAAIPEDNNVYSSGIYLGVSAHVRNMWLLNHTTFRGLKSSDLTTTVPDFGKSFLLIAGKNLSERFTLQIEGAFIDESGQKYLEYVHGNYVSRAIKLDYVTVGLLLKYGRPLLREGRIPVKSNIVFGSYAGYLKSAHQRLDKEIEDLRNDYNSMDFGFVMGYEFDFYIHRRIILTSGFRFKIGLPNVYAGNELIPSAFNRTNTASASFAFGIQYLIPAK